jgi:predicted site-specific integrase-resolvase
MTDDATEAGSDLITPTEAAAYLHVAASTLARWRMYGSGPRYLKLGGRVFYRPSDLNRFIENSLRDQTRS